MVLRLESFLTSSDKSRKEENISTNHKRPSGQSQGPRR